MNENYLNELNEKLYDDGKIREVLGTTIKDNSYTSNVMNRLKKQGYTKQIHKGLCTIKDTEGNILIQEIGEVNALYQLAIEMQ